MQNRSIIRIMVQAKKFENTFINEYLAIQLHKHDIANRAKAEGMAEGRMAMSVDLIKSGLLSVKDAAEKLGISEEELRAKL